jgi:chromosome segregation ATPase
MNMDIINIIVIVAGFATIIKFLFSLKDEIYKLKDEIGNLKIEMQKLDTKIDLVYAELKHKSDLFDNKITNINMKVDKVEQQQEITNKRINKIEDELKEQRTENTQLINKMLDVFKDAPKVAVM